MARTTSALVLGVLGVNYDTRRAPSLTPYIDTASVVTDRVEECAEAKDEALTATELELVERWLAAHFYAHTDQLLQSKQTSDAGGTFQGTAAMFFTRTAYGQAAVTIDHSGCLADIQAEAQQAVDNPSAAAGAISASWLGKPRSEQTDYADRD